MVSSVLLHTFVVCPKVPLRDLSTSSYTWVARSRSESTPQFTALALNKPSSSSSSPPAPPLLVTAMPAPPHSLHSFLSRWCGQPSHSLHLLFSRSCGQRLRAFLCAAPPRSRRVPAPAPLACATRSIRRRRGRGALPIFCGVHHCPLRHGRLPTTLLGCSWLQLPNRHKNPTRKKAVTGVRLNWIG